ncbi:neoverrucotoxin subunit beta-like [Micropterus dolomieu]|uniref:neoverrucotoxin subunit beta-like n=1 Tax=Micropterus dolomieu TaxID=147949 RepID=UPI001E8CF9F1|nr:neoverrucotoxin subunit beta-like [Micropterus dolomieu]
MSMFDAGLTPLSSFRVEPAGVRWLKPGLRKYSCELTLDINTANQNTKLSDNNRKATHVQEDLSYPDHPYRFDYWSQVMCTTGLTGRCYWEVEWTEKVTVAMSYRGISKSGGSEYNYFGGNDKSWRLDCYTDGYSACHNDRGTSISTSSVSNRVGVYLDWPAGSLSFYRVSSDTLIHLHTFNATFTEPLYPGFGLWSCFGSSASL